MTETVPTYEVPKDLFIPPDALEVLLASFSGPLDLLLYLIRKDKINILDIPILAITTQYMQYISMIEAKKLPLAADYLVMAATLAEIKSRMLLPLPPQAEEEEQDPRMALVRQLQAYEQIKQAASLLDSLARLEREHHLIQVQVDATVIEKVYQPLVLTELVDALQGVLQRARHFAHHQVKIEPLSVRSRMLQVLSHLKQARRLELNQLYSKEEGQAGLVVSLLAVLELAKQAVVSLQQEAAFSPIQIGAK